MKKGKINWYLTIACKTGFLLIELAGFVLAVSIIYGILFR